MSLKIQTGSVKDRTDVTATQQAKALLRGCVLFCFVLVGGVFFFFFCFFVCLFS